MSTNKRTIMKTRKETCRRMERMKKKVLIALAMCMALGTACGKEAVEEEKTLLKNAKKSAQNKLI